MISHDIDPFYGVFNKHLKNVNAGPKQDDISAKNYILKKYLNENPDPDRTCYSHFTTATGTHKNYFSLT
jgi:hypothetical protein